MPDLLTIGPIEARDHLLLAHGAGAPMTSPFMTAMAELVANRGLSVTRFEFGYMAERRTGGKRRPPPKAEALVAEYETAIETLAKGRTTLGPTRLFIGGKSMGGRVASLIAGRLYGQGAVSGLVCLGYPFHPPGKPEALRTAHLEQLQCPALIVQGECDPFGTRAEVGGYRLSRAIGLHWVAGANHDLAAPGGAKANADRLAQAADAVAAFVREI